MGFYPCETRGCGGYFCSVDGSTAPHSRFCALAPEPWWKDDKVVLERMLAWKGDGPPPNYLQWAYDKASPSLLHVSLRIRDEKQADLLVHKAHMTGGTRMCLRLDHVLRSLECST